MRHSEKSHNSQDKAFLSHEILEEFGNQGPRLRSNRSLKKFPEFYDKQMFFNARSLIESVKIVSGWASIFNESICNELTL